MRRRPRFAAAPSAPSKAASTARAIVSPTCSAYRNSRSGRRTKLSASSRQPKGGSAQTPSLLPVKERFLSSRCFWGKPGHDTMTFAVIDLDKAKLDPQSVFNTPDEVLSAPGLSPDDKKAILVRWEADVDALLRATGEGMPPSDNRPSPAE